MSSSSPKKRTFGCFTKKRDTQSAKIYDCVINNNLKGLQSFSKAELLEAKLTNYEYNILHLAVSYNSKDIVDYIIGDSQLKELMNKTDQNGDTPVHTAIFYQNLSSYKKMEDSGALNNPNNADAFEVIKDPYRWKFLKQVEETPIANQSQILLQRIQEINKVEQPKVISLRPTADPGTENSLAESIKELEVNQKLEESFAYKAHHDINQVEDIADFMMDDQIQIEIGTTGNDLGMSAKKSKNFSSFPQIIGTFDEISSNNNHHQITDPNKYIIS